MKVVVLTHACPVGCVGGGCWVGSVTSAHVAAHACLVGVGGSVTSAHVAAAPGHVCSGRPVKQCVVSQVLEGISCEMANKHQEVVDARRRTSNFVKVGAIDLRSCAARSVGCADE